MQRHENISNDLLHTSASQSHKRFIYINFISSIIFGLEIFLLYLMCERISYEKIYLKFFDTKKNSSKFFSHHPIIFFQFKLIINFLLILQHANNVRRAAEEYLVRRQARQKSMTRSMTTGLAGPILSMGSVHFLPAAKVGTFFARDNVSNFIAWCRWVMASFNCNTLLLMNPEVVLCMLVMHIADDTCWNPPQREVLLSR